MTVDGICKAPESAVHESGTSVCFFSNLQVSFQKDRTFFSDAFTGESSLVSSGADVLYFDHFAGLFYGCGLAV